jgi:peptidoglycan-associated lipoprotein
MKKRIIIGVSILTLLIGCGQQPELDVNAQQHNEATQNVKQQAITDLNNTTINKPKEEDLTDTSAVNISNESLEESDSKNYQKLASSLTKEVVYFNFDKYNIKDDQMPKVQEVANLLKDNNMNYTVRIEGNCDEWGSDEYNYALGLKRAKVVKNALIDLGVDKNKLTIISYGESNPVCTAHNKECWAKNRRDNFTLLP